MKDVLLPQEEWDANYARHPLVVAPGDDPIRAWLTRHLGGEKGACLEFGCFPGRFLAVLGELGFELHGIDLTPRVETDLPAWLRGLGHRTGTFARGDVFLHEWPRRFEVVCSFGLIEHFAAWEDLFRRHARLVAPGGWLFISTPNFRSGLQGFVHRHLDQENLAKHNVAAMDPDRWRELAREEGLEVVESGGFGSFDCWVGAQRRGLPAKIIVRLLPKIRRWLARILPEGDPRFAPYYGIVARRPTEPA